MILNSLPQNASLGSFLHARAFAAHTRRLVLDVAVGSLVAVAAAWVRPSGWVMIACIGGCFAMYGLWALAERRLEDERLVMSRGPEVLWEIVRGGAALLGIASVLLLMFSAVAATLGTWIS
jgi:hypothetical protein